MRFSTDSSISGPVRGPSFSLAGASAVEFPQLLFARQVGTGIVRGILSPAESEDAVFHRPEPPEEAVSLAGQLHGSHSRYCHLRGSTPPFFAVVTLLLFPFLFLFMVSAPRVSDDRHGQILGVEDGRAEAGNKLRMDGEGVEGSCQRFGWGRGVSSASQADELRGAGTGEELLDRGDWELLGLNVTITNRI